jgi:hypothetical protein
MNDGPPICLALLHFAFHHIHSHSFTNLASPISRGTSSIPETAGKSARAGFAVAGNSIEKSVTARETKGFLDEFPIDLIINDKY